MTRTPGRHSLWAEAAQTTAGPWLRRPAKAMIKITFIHVCEFIYGFLARGMHDRGSPLVGRKGLTYNLGFPLPNESRGYSSDQRMGTAAG